MNGGGPERKPAGRLSVIIRRVQTIYKEHWRISSGCGDAGNSFGGTSNHVVTNLPVLHGSNFARLKKVIQKVMASILINSFYKNNVKLCICKLQIKFVDICLQHVNSNSLSGFSEEEARFGCGLENGDSFDAWMMTARRSIAFVVR